MTVKIEGKHDQCERFVTGLYSLDRAFINDEGELGVLVGVGYELFGSNHVGKSTFAYSLAGLIAKSGIALCDFEGFDVNFLRSVLETSGFNGTLNTLISETEDIEELTDEEYLGRMIKKLKTDEYQVGILDSIGAISPISEVEGDFGEANMGRRAIIMAQFSRKGTKLLRYYPDKTIIAINHWYPRIGTRGYDTPGGEVKKFLLTVRILLKRKQEFPDGSYILEGNVRKNRWGYKDKSFYVFMLAGRGLHKGLTSLWDCVLSGKASYGKGGYVKIEKENIGRLSALAKEAKQGNDEIFEPFMELLNEKPEDQD